MAAHRSVRRCARRLFLCQQAHEAFSDGAADGPEQQLDEQHAEQWWGGHALDLTLRLVHALEGGTFPYPGTLNDQPTAMVRLFQEVQMTRLLAQRENPTFAAAMAAGVTLKPKQDGKSAAAPSATDPETGAPSDLIIAGVG